MLQRWSFLSSIPYNQWVTQNVLGQNVIEASKAIVQSNLYSGNMTAGASLYVGQQVNNQILSTGKQVIDATRLSSTRIADQISTSSGQTIGAIQQSTNIFNDRLNKLILANMFGSLMTIGAIAVSTHIISKKLDHVATGIERLGIQFKEGFSILASQLDIQTNKLGEIKDQLEKIYETLKSPTITKATEWRNLGLERMGNSLFPEAKQAFISSLDLDSTDPISNMMLGKICLDVNEQSLYNPEQATEYFQKAARYAAASLGKAPQLNDIRIESLYLIALAYLALASSMQFDNLNEEKRNKNITQGLSAIDQLLSLSPKHLQGKYLRSKLLIAQKREDEAIQEFKSLVEIDFQYLSTALCDDDFVKYSCVAQKVFGILEPKIRNIIRKYVDEFYSILDDTRNYEIELPVDMINWLSKENLIDANIGKLKLNSLQYIDLFDPNKPIYMVLQLSSKELSGLLEYQKKKIYYDLQDSISLLKNDIIKIDWFYVDYFMSGKTELQGQKALDEYLKSISNIRLNIYKEEYAKLKALKDDIKALLKLSIIYKDIYDSAYHFIKSSKINFDMSFLFAIIFAPIFSIILSLISNSAEYFIAYLFIGFIVGFIIIKVFEKWRIVKSKKQAWGYFVKHASVHNPSDKFLDQMRSYIMR